ncbi:hypothetical protein BSKO_09701 [Bryopsis sp. KO-2023]|nr:hypothetical protein BSKO_09701 [Bryopsis sp. KO-2023]
MHGILARARKVLFCCFDGSDIEPSFELASSSRASKGEKIAGSESILLSVSVGQPPHEPGCLTPPAQVSFTATSSIPSSTLPPSTIPSASRPSIVDTEAERVGNVVDVHHLVADLMLDGARPTVAGAAHHEGDVGASLALLEGCCRGSIPQPADSNYQRDLSHFTDPLTHHLPPSYPRTRLPQFDDPDFYLHIDPFQIQSGEPEATTEDFQQDRSVNFENRPSPGDVSWWYQSEENFSLFPDLH